MNKETFLEELRGYLRILEDQEQEDILEEYAQHIDMKIQKGLSEEEAIRDFGPMKDLAAEILEAYHVKPEFDKKAPVVRMPKLKGVKLGNGGKLFRKAGSFLKAKTVLCIQGIGRGVRWMGRKLRAMAAWIVKPFFRKRISGETGVAFPNEENGVLINQEEYSGMDTGINAFGQMENGKDKILLEKGIEMERRPKRSFLTAFVRGIKRVWNLFAAFCIWWLRLFWNLGWLFMTLFFGFFTMIMLMGLGFGMVLLPQGYPLWGTLLICLGGMLCLGALCCGSFSLIIRKEKEKSDEEEESGQNKEEAEADDREEELTEEQESLEEETIEE